MAIVSKLTTTAALVLAQCLVGGHASNFAIARTFSLHDATKLPGSFDVWNSHPPCEGTTSAYVDLFLVFSQSLESSSVAQSAIEEVGRRFQETSGWDNCIGRVLAFGVDIDPDSDTYKPSEQETNPLWVNGPNRQFGRTVRKLQEGRFGFYDSMYLMEMDSVPVKAFWLDIILDEINGQKRDFAILGSKYRGDKWDAFFPVLPSSLVNHINGNAIYNLTHPFFNRVLEELEVEASTTANSIPYDYRTSQIIEEVKTGVKASFFPYFEERASSPVSEEFVLWAKQFDLDEIIKEVPAIGNYASTNIVPSYVDAREAVIHGAILRSSWDADKLGNVTLVVSDWTEAHSRALLSTLDDSHHPFAKVVVLLPDVAQYRAIDVTSAQVEFVHRAHHPDFLDLCTAPINTSWFMITDSYHQLRQDLQLMVQYEQGCYKPVVTFSKAGHASCFAHLSCQRELKLARQILPSAVDIYQTQDFVFHTESRNEYCKAWEKSFRNETPPSATSFVAFLQDRGQAKELYVHSDSGSVGSRPAFLQLPTSSLPPVMKLSRRLTENPNTTNQTSIECTSLRSRGECDKAGCEWRLQFSSCRENPSNVDRDQPGRHKRPHWAQILISLGISCGAIAFITLLVVGVTRLRPNDSTASLVPLSSQGDFYLEGDSSHQVLQEENGAQEDDDRSFESIDLDGLSVLGEGRFEENESGVEFFSEKVEV